MLLVSKQYIEYMQTTPVTPTPTTTSQTENHAATVEWNPSRVDVLFPTGVCEQNQSSGK